MFNLLNRSSLAYSKIGVLFKFPLPSLSLSNSLTKVIFKFNIKFLVCYSSGRKNLFSSDSVEQRFEPPTLLTIQKSDETSKEAVKTNVR